MAEKARDAFRTISEVANWLDVPAHVLRFWESKFSQIKPVKRAGGRRYYRPSDMQLIGGIKKLLHDDGMTIRGVQKMLKEEGVKAVVAMSPELTMANTDEDDARRRARRARRTARLNAKTGEVTPDTGANTESQRATSKPATPEQPASMPAKQEEPQAAESARPRNDAPLVLDTNASPDESDDQPALDLDAPAPEPASITGPFDEGPAVNTGPPVAAPPVEHPAMRMAADLSPPPEDPNPEQIEPSQAQLAAARNLRNVARLGVSAQLTSGSDAAVAQALARLETLRSKIAADIAAH